MKHKTKYFSQNTYIKTGDNKPVIPPQPTIPILDIPNWERASYISDIKEIHSIQSKTYEQSDMLDYIYYKILEYGGNATFDKAGNLYGTKGLSNAYPCVVAHTDTVHDIIPNSAFEVVVLEDKMFAIDNRSCTRVGIGGDDKVGIFLALEAFKNNDAIKVAFFVDEEHGCIGSREAEMSFFKDVSFVMQGDRKKYSDFTNNIMGVQMFDKDFSNKINDIAEMFNKKEVRGGLTDVYQLAQNGLEVCAFNSSCGYYDPHRPIEYIVIDEVILTSVFFQEVINKLYDGHTRYLIDRKLKNQYTFHESWKPKFHCRKCKTKLEEDLDNMFFCNNCSNYQSIDEITIL